jgi:putative GTP pyrophosphokinase
MISIKPTDRFPVEEFEKLKEHLVVYRCALNTLETIIGNIDDYYSSFGDDNPIEHIKYRIKSPESMAAKLKSKDLPITAEAAVSDISDIAGARIICSYAKDIGRIADILRSESDIRVISEKDYVASPKESGYRSYHMKAEVNPGAIFGGRFCRVEIQIRTAAMDFWASLEHKARYKYGREIPESLIKDLRVCADRINELDDRMYMIHELVDLISE